jgi:CheY-specific phosphatase CheX
MSAKFLGQYLLEKGAITADGLLKAVAHQEQHNLKLHDYLEKQGVISAAQKAEVLAETKRSAKFFVDVLFANGIITKEKLAEHIYMHKQTRMKIGEALVQAGAITQEALDRELIAYAKEGSEAWLYPVASVAPAPLPPPPGIDQVRGGGAHTLLLFSATARLLFFTAGFRSKIQEIEVACGELGPADLEVAIGFKGALSGRFLLRVPEAMAKEIAVKTAELDPTPAVQADAVRELANVAAGGVCSQLSELGLEAEISPPEHVVHVAARKVACVRCPIYLADGHLEAVFVPA